MLAARLTGEAAARTAQRIVEFEPEPPLGKIACEGSRVLAQGMTGLVLARLPKIFRN